MIMPPLHFSVIWYACFATRPPVLRVYSLVPVYLPPCVPSCFSILLVSVCYSFLAFSAVISYVFLPALPWQPERVSNALVGLLTLRLPSLGWVFLASFLRLRFPFYLGPLSPLYLLAATQGLVAYSSFIAQSFWCSLKDLLAQLSASISSLVVSLYAEFKHKSY